MASTSTSGESVVYTYKKLVVPVSMRSIYWKYFGFPASDDGEIITKLKIICILCKSQIAYNKNTSNLRMHLQNKHLQELINIESQLALDSSGKNKVIKKPFKLKSEVHLGVSEENQNESNEFYMSEESSQVFQVSEGNDAEGDYVYSHVTKKFPHVSAEESKSITEAIANFIISDLQPPQIVDGRGFLRLLVTLKSPCEIPSTSKLTYDVIPKMYKNVKESLQGDLSNLNSDIGLTLEEWTNINNQNFLTISVYYKHPISNTVLYKVLNTVSILPTADANAWEHILDDLFSEWNIDYTKVTAVTFATSREEILAAMYNKGYTLVPCLDYTIKECAKICFDNETIKDIISRVRGIITTIARNSQAWQSLVAQETSLEGTLQSDNENVWMSTLSMLEHFLVRKDAVENLLQSEIDYALKDGLELMDSDWDILQDVVTVLEPFKVTLMTLSEEKIPLISLLKPLLWQVINNKLSEKESDSVTLQSLKKAIIDHLTFRYNDEQISSLLQIATMLDPRFKLLPYSTEDEKSSTGEIIKEMLVKIIEEQDLPVEEPVAKKNRMSGMELLLGNFNCKKLKMNPSESANIEYNQFYNDTTAPLDSCPVQWWSTHRTKYSKLSLLADKYICVPACTTFPGKITTDTQNSFYIKRAAFTSDHNFLDQVLFLHINQSSP